MTRYLLRATALLVCLAPAAHAQIDTACWNRDHTRLDALINPPEKGDNNFFTVASSEDDSTNVVLIYAATDTMKDFTQRLYKIRADLGGATPTGCTNAYFDNLNYFMPTDVTAPSGAAALQGAYSVAKTYPDPGPTYSGGSGQSDNLTAARAYRYRNWGANGGQVMETVANACTNANAALTVACQACVNTKGYWLNPAVADNNITPAAGVFSTNFLRFHPPKWTLLSLAYKRLVNGPLLSVLREGVVAPNGTNGGQVVQKMLPQSCRGAGRPMNQKLGAIDALNYSTGANPLSEMLFNAAWFMAGQPAASPPWPFTNAATKGGAPMANGKSEPCNNCSGDFIVLFSDGRGDTANPSCTPVAAVTPAHCQAAASCTTLGMGVENDGNDFLDPGMAGGAGALITSSGVRQLSAGTCDMDFAEDVARFMAFDNTYATGAGTRVKTYVVAIGDPSNQYGELSTLRAISSSASTPFTVADNFRDLESNISDVFTAIITRATSFSAAAVTTVQSTGFTSALIPRFAPSGNSHWSGSLMRFQLFNEFAGGCAPADLNVTNVRNPNGNNSCNDVYLADNGNNFIGEDSMGQFVRLNSSVPWDGGWPILTGADGGTTPAVPTWEASQKLTSRMNDVIGGDNTKVRQIYTVAPNGTTGTYAPALVPFTVANVATIGPLLKMGNYDDANCTTLGYLARKTYTTNNQCWSDVIRFIHGYDLLLENPYNRTIPAPAVQKARPNILGDIFHSTPVMVTPPVKSFLCDLGIANQCVTSLYGPTLTPGGQAAYTSYSTTNQYRTQFILVAANDGMLHAFNAGNDVVAGTVHSYDLGTGEEMWAFIPPDVLPKLIMYMIGERHELLVDGTPMVRDVWADGSGASTTVDHAKQADEFHTLVVVGEREGGRHYLALDVTNPTTPAYRWTWPPPGTAMALDMGESWNDLGPAAPPIGAIAEINATGAFSVGGQQVRERYVVAVGGGNDPAFLRGRSINFIDAWSGSTVYRYAAMDATLATDVRKKLFSVPSPMSMLDSNGDGLFDAAVVGDIGGQVWTVSMKNPGNVNAVTGLYDNWYAGRAFVQNKGGQFKTRSPFYQRPVATKLPSGDVRIYLGSGDRDQIKDPNGGTCGLANLGACIRKNCAVTVTGTRYRVGAAPQGAATGMYVNGSFTLASAGLEPTQNISVSAGSGLACTDTIDAQLDFSIDCGGGVSGTYQSLGYCDWTAGAECPDDIGRPFNTKLVKNVAVTNSRFYAFRLFDTGTRLHFTSAAQAATYDTNSLTDTDLVNADTTTSGVNGFFINHAHSQDEKTSSSALLLGGCAIWNTLVPTTAVATCGASLPFDTAHTFQADAITGAIGCGDPGTATALATVRSVSRTTYVAPQQPSLVVSVNANGEVAYGGVSIEPGASPLSVVMATGNISGQTIHWLEVPRKAHDCRHGGTNCN